VKTKTPTTSKTSRRAQKKQSKQKTKQVYRLRNWKEYNRALRERGSLNIWVDQETLHGWLEPPKSGQRGASRMYADTAILCGLMLQAIYHLPLRATEGMLRSIFTMLEAKSSLGAELPVPDYTTLCRRRQTLDVKLPRTQRDEPIHLVVDSTGLKVFGEGEWKVRQHGWCKRRTWRKLHLGIDEATSEIAAAGCTENNVSDAAVLPQLLKQVEEPISQVSGDGGYDQRRCYEAIRERGAKATIPPRKGARIWQHGNSKEERLKRDENLRDIRKKGRKKWKQESGYHRRSLAETAMFRLKTIFGPALSARSFGSQGREMFVRCAALNHMTALGMPDSYPV
jgi:IS5 family transposase